MTLSNTRQAERASVIAVLGSTVELLGVQVSSERMLRLLCSRRGFLHSRLGAGVSARWVTDLQLRDQRWELSRGRFGSRRVVQLSRAEGVELAEQLTFACSVTEAITALTAPRVQIFTTSTLVAGHAVCTRQLHDVLTGHGGDRRLSRHTSRLGRRTVVLVDGQPVVTLTRRQTGRLRAAAALAVAVAGP